MHLEKNVLVYYMRHAQLCCVTEIPLFRLVAITVSCFNQSRQYTSPHPRKTVAGCPYRM